MSHPPFTKDLCLVLPLPSWTAAPIFSSLSPSSPPSALLPQVPVILPEERRTGRKARAIQSSTRTQGFYSSALLAVQWRRRHAAPSATRSASTWCIQAGTPTARWRPTAENSRPWTEGRSGAKGYAYDNPQRRRRVQGAVGCRAPRLLALPFPSVAPSGQTRQLALKRVSAADLLRDHWSDPFPWVKREKPPAHKHISKQAHVTWSPYGASLHYTPERKTRTETGARQDEH